MSEPIQWQRAQHTYRDQEHKFTLTGLQPNSEYVYRIVSSEDNTWACSTKSSFDWFTTKTEGPAVIFVDLENRQGVSSLSTITVRANCAQHRFSTYGITNVELLVDGEQANQFTKTTATSHVDYTFDLSGLNLGNGVHRLVAVAYDDYWQISNSSISILLNSVTGQQIQSSSVMSTTNSPQDAQPGKQLPKNAMNVNVTYVNVKLGYRPPPYAPLSHAYIMIDNIGNGLYPLVVTLPVHAPGAVRTDKYRKTIDALYTVKYVNINTAQKLRDQIKKDAAHPPEYDLLNSDDPLTHHSGYNCASWISHLFDSVGWGMVVPYEHRTMKVPAHAGVYADYLNMIHKKPSAK